MPVTGESHRPPLIDARDLTVEYGSDEDALRAVDHVSLTIHEGEAVGLAGESGSGKSTFAHALTRLLRPPARISSGKVLYYNNAPNGDSHPVDIGAMSRRALEQFRWAEVAVVLQSAMNAMNPVLSIQTQLSDVLHAHLPSMTRAERSRRCGELLELVGIDADRLRAYPHELSGGMRQRVMIAMALALNPRLVIMDEPTTALDVVTQRQILTELAGLRSQFGFAMLFITHDLSLLLETADTIAVMYAGRIIETATSRELYEGAAHPYSVGLLGSFPPLSGPRRTLVGIPGSPPDLRALPAGCAFAPRCPFADERCVQQRPELAPPAAVPDSRRRVACFHDRISVREDGAA